MTMPMTVVKLLVALFLLAEALGQEDSACSTSLPIEAHGESMLQTKQHKETPRSSAAKASLGQGQSGQMLEECPLPAGAKWCEVRLQNQEPYWMATYDTKVGHEDLVSLKICTEGFWEEPNPASFGEPGHMLDIGGHIGFFTFAFAHSGWTVTTFEPMATNLALIHATMCLNPDLAARIQLNEFGLGTKPQECKMMAGKKNVGNGHTRCEDMQQTPGVHVQKMEDLVEIGHFKLRRLDEALAEQGVAKVDIVKIDVEGDQAQVFAGAPNFLTQYSPRIIKSEVWASMAGMGEGSGVKYLDMFERAGYKFFTDNGCTVPIDAKTELQKKGGFESLMICKQK